MTRDRAIVFGRSNGLVGIVTDPVDPPFNSNPECPAAIPPAIIIMNTGVTHRVGTNRMSTIWSRRLAQRGHCVLRFDMPGLGDSARSDENLSVLGTALAAIREAVDWLAASRGIDRVILVGLCSGADQSLLYAGGDPRIAGLVLIDPSIPPTPRFYWRYFMRRLTELHTWLGIFRVSLRALKVISGRSAPPRDAQEYRPMALRDPRVRVILTEAYQAALTSNIAILAIFTAGVTFQHNYPTQLLDAFPDIAFGEKLQLEYFEGCDHNFTFEINRARLFNVADEWLSRTPFKPPMPAQRSPAADGASSRADSDHHVIVEF